MSLTPGFVQYVCEQISATGEITSKKMFGEYGIYCNNKIMGLRIYVLSLVFYCLNGVLGICMAMIRSKKIIDFIN